MNSNEPQNPQLNIADVMLSLPDRKTQLLQTLKKLQEDNKIADNEFQKGYYNGFEDGCYAIIEFLLGNGA